LDTKNRMRFNY